MFLDNFETKWWISAEQNMTQTIGQGRMVSYVAQNFMNFGPQTA